MKKTMTMIVCLLAAAFSTRAQGPLIPPGAPAPTMKTLEQIEPRTPINNLPVTISVPGSYYLTTNLTGIAGTSGIRIATGRVTLDLMGFSLAGVPGSRNGVEVVQPVSNVVVRNGVIRNWDHSGVLAHLATHARYTDLHAMNNTLYGLFLGENASVSDCIGARNELAGIQIGDMGLLTRSAAISNGYYGVIAGRNSVVSESVSRFNVGYGFAIGEGSTVNDCSAAQNFYAGYYVGSGSQVNRCIARDNLEEGFVVTSESQISHSVATRNAYDGIRAHTNVVVRACIASGNLRSGIITEMGAMIRESSAMTNIFHGIRTGTNSIVESCVAGRNREHGIWVDSGSIVRGCTVNSNRIDGIRASGDCLIEGNVASLNGASGIRTTSSKNIIQNNMLTRNAIGLRVDSFGSFIAGNKAYSIAGGTNYVIAVDNKVGPTDFIPNSPAFSGGTGGSGMGTTNPWANFSY